MVQQKFRQIVVFVAIVLLVPMLVQCNTPPAAPTAETHQTDAPKMSAETAPDGVESPAGYAGKSWADIMAEADGQTVNWYMWGGQENINRWVTGYVAERLKQEYNVTLNMVPIEDAAAVVNKVLGEKQAGNDTDGTVDLIWINGENFRTARQGSLLFGPWSQFLPNSRYVNWDDASVKADFGYPVEYHESPYGKAQFVMIYDSAKVPQPPQSMAALLEWIKANPGKFTYPAPPDFTGTTFMLHVCYHTAGEVSELLTEFDQALFEEKFASCWQTLNELEPYLWREGQTYPESHADQQNLFANSELYFDMAYNPAEASSHVESGKFPETTRTFVFDGGTIANTHYVAIPYNSPNKAGAMVLANLLISPEAQHSKADVANWGDFPAIDVNLLSAEWQAKFKALPRGVATLPDDILAQHRLPELPSPWRVAAEKAWEEEVLKQ